MLKKINILLSKTSFPILLKIFSLLIFIGLVIIGFSASSKDQAFLKILRNTNLANLFNNSAN